MAESEHIAKLSEGVEAWNDWRNSDEGASPILRNIDFYSEGWHGAHPYMPEYFNFNFSRCDFNMSSLRNCIFSECDFSGARLTFSDLVGSLFMNCSFQGVRLNVSRIGSAEFSECDFTDAELSYCTAEETSFIGSQFIRTKLDKMSLIKSDFSNTTIDGVMVYGTSAWDLNLDGSIQQNIYISDISSKIIVPDIELAQFIALLVNNSKIRDIIDTITSKVVLILGRFTKSRKEVLNAIKNELPLHGYLPVLFDFKGPESRDLTETILTLASMSKFVVADLSMAKSIPQELTSIVPHFPSVPVQPIIRKQGQEYVMFEHFKQYPWVLKKLEYTDDQVPNLVHDIVNNCEKYLSSKPN